MGNSIHNPTPTVSTVTTEIDLLDIKPNDIDLTDMAVSLARKGRYTDLSELPVTVLQHLAICDHLADTLPGGDQLDVRMLTILHDAHEYILGDISRPLKMLFHKEAPGLIESLETEVDAAIMSVFGLPEEMALPTHPARDFVKRVDNLALAHEVTYAFPQVLDRWDFLPEIDQDFHHNVAIPIINTQPVDIFNSFIRRIQELSDQYHRVTTDVVGVA